MIHTTAELLEMDFGNPIEATDMLVHKGCAMLGMPTGIVARQAGTRDRGCEVVIAHGNARIAGLDGLLDAVLDACTNAGGPIAVAGTSEMPGGLDTICEAGGVRSLIAAPVTVDGKHWGLVLFASEQPRTSGWTDADRSYIRVLASLCRLFHVQVLDAIQQRDKASHDLRLILDHVPSLVFFKDDKNTILQTNKAAADSLGLKPEEVAGRPAEDFYDHADLYLADDLEILRSGEPKLGYIEPYSSADGLRYIQTDKIPVATGPGEPNRILAIATDITDRVLADEKRLRYEDALRAAKSAAELADQAKSAFLANMSHEIRTPMTAILGYAELLLDPMLDDAERSNSIENIRRNGGHLLGLINDILDLSKIEAGQLQTESLPIRVTDLIDDVVATIGPKAREKGLSIDVRATTPIPETFHTDPLRLRQIVLNLANNAVKFTEHGGVTIELSCDASDADHARLGIAVSDTGIGMSPDQLEKLFTPFQQADRSTTRKFGGTGLGLAISRHLARHLHGDIDVTSDAGVGTTVTLHLDIGASAALDMTDYNPTANAISNHTPDGQPIAPVGKPLNGVRILLAEDGLDNQRIINAFLTSAGAAVTIVENGQLAVDAVLEGRRASDDTEPFDAILMDMQMPVLDGYGASNTLRHHDFERPIIALTAHAMVDEPSRCMLAGCDLYLSKPIDRNTLVNSVADIIAEYRNRQPAGAPNALISPAPVDDLATGKPIQAITSPMEHDPDLAPVLRAFVERLPQIATDLHLTLVASDYTTLHRLTHQLKGAGGSYQLPQITTAAERLSHIAEARPAPDVLETAVNELISVLRRVKGFDDTGCKCAAA
ncbi:MAG: ATP-binding protein [Planctomycetota bacterium]